MKPIGLSRLTSILERQEHSSLFGKNGVVHPIVGNERGFRKSSSSLPYSNYIGHIVTDTKPIIFTTDGVYSAIGFYNVVDDTYEPILNDASLSYKLEFSTEGHIEGEARKNYLGQIEITWVDTHNVPRFLNTEKVPTSIDLFNLFLTYNSAKLVVSSEVGGNLKRGAYYVGMKYLFSDGSETDYSTLQGPIFAISDSLISQSSLRITITGLDIKFDKIKLVVVENVDGIVTPRELDEIGIPPTGNINYVYNSTVKATVITLEEVLIPSAFYKNAKAITQEGDTLYLGDVEEEEDVDLMSMFINTKLKWVSKSVSIDDPKIKSGEKMTFKHGEAYALYGAVTWKTGRKSRAFHIPSIPTTPSTINIFDYTGAPYSYNSAADPLSWSNVVGAPGWRYEGDFRTWLNLNETYPNTPEYETLAGERVRHHVFPTVRWCKENLYPNSLEYGISELDILGLKISTIVIPPSLQDKIQSIELYHAKRDYGTGLIFSQGVMIQGVINVEPQYLTTEQEMLNAYTAYKKKEVTYFPPVYFSGTNLAAHTQVGDGQNPDIRQGVWPTMFLQSFNSPDTIVDRFIPPSKLGVRVNGIIKSKFTPPLNSTGGGFTLDTFAAIVDSTEPQTRFLSGATHSVNMVDNAVYLLNGQKGNDVVDNSKSEDKIVLETLTAGWDVRAPFTINQSGQPLVEEEYIQNVDLVNLFTKDVYFNYSTQELVKVGTVDEEQIVFGGDTFIVEFSVNTMGVMAVGHLKWKDKDGKPDTKEFTKQFYRKVLIESSKNLWMRTVDGANPNDKYYDKNLSAASLAAPGFSSISVLAPTFNNDMDINVITIPKEATALSNLLNGIIPFDPWDINVYLNPFKIIRSRRQLREDKYNSWRSFRALDYFETVKDKGKITNLQGYNGNLLIHHEHAIFQTASKTTLSGKEDITTITLGSGDIFQLEPQEGKASATGVGGLQNVQYAAMTDYGYIFTDVEKRVIYVVNEKGLQPLNGELDTLFKDILKGIDGNPFNGGTGVVLGFDEEHYRLLITIRGVGGKNLTFSMSLHTMLWSYAHDYFPFNYIITRNKLLSINSNGLYRFNEGPYGVYEEETIKPYFVDVVFVSKQAFVLNVINWRTIVEEGEDPTKFLRELYDKTFTSLTIWNGDQCSGKIAITKNTADPLGHNSRSPEYEWSMNEFRNILKLHRVEFLEDIFNDFKIKEGILTPYIPWFNKDVFIGDYVIIRFEFDNKENTRLTVKDLNIDVTNSSR